MTKAPVGSAKHRKILLPSSSIVAVMAALALPAGAEAQTSQPLTRAGTLITNTATASYDTGGGNIVTVDSNSVDMHVEELLDVTVAQNGTGDVPTAPGATAQVLSFQVTNSGNGPEAFTLTAAGNVAGDDYDPTVNGIYIDSNGNGVYDPGIDALYPVGSEPLLEPETSMTIFVVATTPATVGDGDRGIVTLTAAAKTGTGTPGTLVPGAVGEGNVGVVIGASGGTADFDHAFRVAAATVTLVKSAVVLNSFGTAIPLPGATITYTIVANVTGSGSVNDLTITDSLPPEVSYQSGSITLDGGTLTDAADGDAGRFDADTVSVALGTVPGGESRTVIFRTKIN
jgi:uncharacterized repeat protein (TIGR01451 family)